MKRILRLLFRWIVRFVLAVVGIWLVVWLFLWLMRPDRTPTKEVLFEGVTYERFVDDDPNVVIHVLDVDVSAESTQFLVTPPENNNPRDHISARTTSQFVEEFGVQVAINASHFYTHSAEAPWSYYPKVGDPVTTVGTSFSGGRAYAYHENSGFIPVCLVDNLFRIGVANGYCPPGTQEGFSGIGYLVQNGISNPFDDTNWPYPRTAIGINEDGSRLWLIVVDGRQPTYSSGMTLPDLADFMEALGVHTGINLDGGGSATMVIDRGDGPKVLNSPIHTRIPLRERPVANHLGIFAKEIEP